MANDGQIVFEVTADGKHAIADIKDITKAIQQEAGKWDSAAKQSSDNISNAFSGMLKKLTAGFSAVKIGKALLDIGQDAIQAASDLQEVQNVVDTTFGADANKIEKWAKNAGTQFGLTETKAKKFTSTIGAMLKSMGMSGDEIVNISTDLSGLAADMSSFYNLDFDEAFQKIRSGLSGETEPLKQLGINMSTANLEAFALQQGLSKTWNEMSQGEQTMLRYQYLMQATADAQGDFAKTSDGYANGLRLLEANLESLKTKLGEVILPVVNDVLNAVNDLFKDRSGDKTVLDDFADIDEETARKLEQIKQTAEEAGSLVSELESIGNTSLSGASGNIQQFVTDLESIDLTNGKANAVKEFVGVLSDNIDALAKIRGTSNKEAKEWLEGISTAAKTLNPEDAAGWQDLINTIKEGLPGLENTDFGQKFFGALNDLEISQKANDVKQFIKELSNNMELVQSLSGKDPEQAKTWLEEIGKAADSLDPGDAAGWKTLIETIKNDLPGIENTELGKGFFESFNELQIGEKANQIKAFIDELSNNMGLVQQLSGKDAEGAAQWLKEIGEAADSLNPNDAAGWQTLLNTIKQDLPGIENTSLGSKFFESFNGLQIGDKAEKIKGFISDLANNMGLVQSLSGKDAEGASEWLTEISNAANNLDANDAAGWTALLDSIKEGLPGLENTEFGKAFFESLSNGFDSVGSETSTLDWALEVLGNKTNRTADEQAYWLEICKQLVSTIPGLSSIINTETGEIKGGTQAVKDYIQAWEDGQTRLALLGALEQKESALASRFSDLPGLQLDMALEKRKMKQAYQELQDIAKKYGITPDDLGGYRYMQSANYADYDAAVKAYEDQKKIADNAEKAYKAQADALEEAKQALEEYRATIEETYGTEEKTLTATEKYWQNNADSIRLVTEAAQSAVTALSDYAKGVNDSMIASINGVAKGLQGVNYKSYEKQMEDIKAIETEMGGYDVGSDEWEKLNTKLQKANEGLISTTNIYKGLESQAAFLDDYLANMEQARKLGLSNELLAELSDGSVESAMYLDALVNDKTGKTAAEIDKKYQEIQGKKAELAKELSSQQLAVDEVYLSLAEKAKEAVAALDLGEQAGINSGNTIKGMAEGIASHMPEVQSAVDSILEQLDRLNGYGINIDFGGFGSINFTTNAGKTEGSSRMGLSFVPHDDYIARLHEGERVLTAQENQIWNALRNGGVSGFDLETLGGVMRDNVVAGGNVYLDGKIVGSVISDQQGRSYRQLQRSGWQG